jgi:hypothetical protein
LERVLAVQVAPAPLLLANLVRYIEQMKLAGRS